MGGSILGKELQLITFGESHGVAMGGVIEGFPSGVEIDYPLIKAELLRRQPAGESFSTQRMEPDDFEILSGVFEGKTLGTPIAFIVRNKQQKPSDYNSLQHNYRPSHADYTWQQKYGIRDPRGGGRASARETVSRVFGGAFAKMLLNTAGISVHAYVSAIGEVRIANSTAIYTLNDIESSPLRCPDKVAEGKMLEALSKASDDGDTLGGVISCVIENCPPGLGEPVFDKLESDLAHAIMSIPSVKGFDIGSGFKGATMRGSVHNDPFVYDTGNIRTSKNDAGGVLGGISSGEKIVFRAAFKPVSSIHKEQKTVDEKGKPSVIAIHGRHDTCVVPRAVPIVEAMAAWVLADHLMRNKMACS